VLSKTLLVVSITCVIPCLVPSVSLNGTLHETMYNCMALIKKLPNYVSGTSGTHLVSSFYYRDSLTSDGALKVNNGYATRLNYLRISQTAELYKRFHSDLFNSNEILMS